MPRGMHPNSRKALEENRQKTQFHRESAVEAQKESAKAVVRNRTFKEEFQLELQTMIKDSNGNETSVQNAITKTMIQKALKGDIRAAEFVRDTSGQKPTETVEVLAADYSALEKIRDELRK